MTPAECAYKAFGSRRALARAIGWEHSAVAKWNKRNGGSIPENALRPVFEAAEYMGLKLTARELIVGKNVKRLKALSKDEEL